MRTNVWFAPKVIETMKYYRGGASEIRSVESYLEKEPLIGRQYFDGIQAIRAINKPFLDQPFVLTWLYLFAPLADYIPRCEMDEIVVIHVGSVSMATHKPISDYERHELNQEIINIWDTVKSAV